MHKQNPFFSVSYDAIENTVDITNTLFDTASRLVRLHLGTARAVLEDGSEGLYSLLQSPNPGGMIAMQTGLMQPTAERTKAYYRDCYDLLIQTLDEVAQPMEKQFAQATAYVRKQLDGMGVDTSHLEPWALSPLLARQAPRSVAASQKTMSSAPAKPATDSSNRKKAAAPSSAPKTKSTTVKSRAAATRKPATAKKPAATASKTASTAKKTTAKTTTAKKASTASTAKKATTTRSRSTAAAKTAPKKSS